MEERTIHKIQHAQQNELNEYYIYQQLARSTKHQENQKILTVIADDELRHYKSWRQFTHKDLKPQQWVVWKYYILAKIFGITFGIKLMEKGEKTAQKLYQEIISTVPEAKKILEDEHRHETTLIATLHETRLEYVGSVVLGLNDAIVELTGALAGFTLALHNPRLIAMTGLITGIAASLSMSSSEYLSTKSEASGRRPLRAALATGSSYLITVGVLITPYILVDSLYTALLTTVGVAIIIIYFFTYYTAVAQDLPFRQRFLEMTLLSLGVAAITFGIGYVVHQIFGV